MSESLKNKVALITGSSRGIGKSIALAFASEGVDVVINYKKSSLMYLTKSLAKHYAPEVRVNAIAPGYTQTDLFLERHEHELSDITKKVPLKRINLPEDIAQGAVYLCKAANITGHVLVIDGGSSL